MFRICKRQFENVIEYKVQKQIKFLFFKFWINVKKLISVTPCGEIYRLWFYKIEDCESLIIEEQKSDEYKRKLKGINKAKTICNDLY